MARVLFVSKPIGPPWNDGSKCLVRDIASHLLHTQAAVMTTSEPARDAALAGLEFRPVYRNRGHYAPSIYDNARVALHLLFSGNSDIWHFVMAPNARTCQVARALRQLRRVPVVQTIASQPRSFRGIDSLLFGDVVVAQSEWTRATAAAAMKDSARELEVIPPPIGPLVEPDPQAILAARQQFQVPPGAPLFLYPGDLEVSQGARTVAALVEPVVRAIPEAVFVLACREKTAHAAGIRAELQQQLAGAPVRFAAQVENFAALLAAASAVLFPVDDLYGKVDLPITLLEAMALGVPVVALGAGPLLDLKGGAELIDPGDQDAWIAACAKLARNAAWRDQIAERGKQLVRARHAGSVVAAAYERLYERLLAKKANQPGS